MIEIVKLAKKKNLKIIEDCSQAHGASINNQKVGSFGDVATWSFCTDKIISTLGEGGMISTNQKRIFDFSLKYINHGTEFNKSNITKKNPQTFVYNKNSFGTNLRLTEIQSVAGLEQLKNLKNIQKKREKMSRNYYDIIKNIIATNDIPRSDKNGPVIKKKGIKIIIQVGIVSKISL